MDKLEYIKFWINKHKDSGYYISQILDDNDNNLIGYISGSDNSNNYITIDDFYNQIYQQEL